MIAKTAILFNVIFNDSFRTQNQFDHDNTSFRAKVVTGLRYQIMASELFKYDSG